MNYAGQVALVTGGASGIGEGIARALADADCKVVVADIDRAKAEQVASDIRREGKTALAIGCDISSREAVREMRSAVLAEFGPPSLLVANAGVTIFKPLHEMTDAEIDWIMEVDLHGVLHCIQVFSPDMISAGRGHIVATSSVAGLFAAYIDSHAPYVAAKAGVTGLIFSMRRELEPYGIGCTVLCPGKVSTNITGSFKHRPERFGGPVTEKVTLPVGEETQVARDPAEVAQMVMLAIERNRPVVVTHSAGKALFQSGFCDPILQAFDDASHWEDEHLVKTKSV